MITIDHLTKKYSRARALNEVSLRIPRGMYGLLGPNGAGKTTLMHILVTLIPPSSGTVKVGDYELGKDDQQIRGLIGFLPQEFGMYMKLTAREYLDLIGVFKGMKVGRARKQAVDNVLEQVNLTAERSKKVGKLSGGMRRRLGIAQALLDDPQVIIADEPTVGLDPEERLRFRNLLRSLSLEKIVLLSTHIVSDIEDTCDQLAILRTGEVLYEGTQQQLVEQLRDQVWSGVIDPCELGELQNRATIISSHRAPDGEEVRVVCPESPFPNARVMYPHLEDAYIYLTGGRAIV